MTPAARATRRRASADANGEGPAAGALSFPLTEFGLAERLSATHGRDLRYVGARGHWYWFTGMAWQCDETDTEIVRRAKLTVREMYREAAAIADDQARTAVVTFAKRSEREHVLEAMIALARAEPGLAVPITAFDGHPWLLNCPNGTLDLRTGELRPHDRANLLTRLIATPYDPHATCPLWDAFLNRVLDGREELVRFLQRALGYSLTGSTREQVIFILHGSGGNGKTTLLSTLSDLLGPYSKHADPATFLAKRQDHVRNDLARLYGTRLVTAVEVEEGRRLAEVLVKQCTGGDPLTARFLYREYFQYVPMFKVFLAANHKPVIRGTDHAIWRRIRLIPFTVTIPDADQDPDLPEKLRAELPGILRWAVDGCLAWQRDGLGLPDIVRQATSAYRTEMDALAAFFEQRCEVGPDFSESAGALYRAYADWCEASGEFKLTQTAFGRRLTERGFDTAKQGRFVWRIGVRLAEAGDGSGEG